MAWMQNDANFRFLLTWLEPFRESLFESFPDEARRDFERQEHRHVRAVGEHEKQQHSCQQWPHPDAKSLHQSDGAFLFECKTWKESWMWCMLLCDHRCDTAFMSRERTNQNMLTNTSVQNDESQKPHIFFWFIRFQKLQNRSFRSWNSQASTLECETKKKDVIGKI